MPASAAVAAANRVLEMRRFKAKKRSAGLTLRADNADWAVGSGPVVEGPIESHLLTVTGRRSGVGELEGAGAVTLATRL